MSDCMLDLETLSTDSHAAIIVIGAIKFDRTTNTPSLDKCDSFYRKITLDSIQDFTISKETTAWWYQQDEHIRKEALEGEDRIPLQDALREFAAWYDGCTCVWGNGDDFDCVILGNAFQHFNLETPWRFWQTRDMRTVMDVAGLFSRDLPRGNEHHALHDCWRQIYGVKHCLRILTT